MIQNQKPCGLGRSGHEGGAKRVNRTINLSGVGQTSVQALKYVSFAVQMLGKSFKMMPVMNLA